jgi:hypothetical protein
MFESLSSYSNPTTYRVKKRFYDLKESLPYLDSQRAFYFTEYMTKNWDEPLYLRSAGAFQYVLTHLTPAIWDDELIVGNISQYIKGAQLYPEQSKGFHDFLANNPHDLFSSTDSRAKQIKADSLYACIVLPEEKKRLEQASQFWYDKNWNALCTEYFEKTLSSSDKSDAWPHSFNSLFLSPQPPKSWIVIDYPMILQDGLEKIIHHVQECLKETSESSSQESIDKIIFYKGIIRSLEGIITFAENYAHKAKQLADRCHDDNRKQDFIEIARICSKVPRKAPDSFREALQAFWFIHICLCLELNCRSVSPGRFDQYMNPYLERDLKKGDLSVSEALELLELLRIKSEEIFTAIPCDTGRFLARPMQQQITLAGSDKNGNPSDTLLSKFMLQARIHIHTGQPILSVRWRDDLSDFFKRKVIDCIKTAGWCPDIYHDKSGTQSFSKQAQKQVYDCHNWFVYRQRDEYTKKMPDVIDALFKNHHSKILDLLIDEEFFMPGARTLPNEDARRKSYHKIVQAYLYTIKQFIQKKQMKLDNVSLAYNNTGLVHPFLLSLQKINDEDRETYPALPSYSSRDILISCGMIDLAMVLAAIKKYVVDDAIFTLCEIRDAIQSEFEGAETLRQNLLKASPQSKNNPFFEEALLELLDTWSELKELSRKSSEQTSSSRRFTLIQGKTSKSHRPYHV